MNDADRTTLIDLRRALLHLHKTLLDWERAAYERFHGRVSSHSLLQAIMNDPQFAWLRPMSELIVRIDETLADPSPDTPVDAGALVAQARLLVSPAESGGSRAGRYDAALQDSPDVVFAHRDTIALLKSSSDTALPSQRLH